MVNNELNEEWENYQRTVMQCRDFKYQQIEYISVPNSKGKWVGGVFYQNKIYGVVNSERKGLCIDTKNKSYHLFGQSKIGTFKWTGGCVYRDKIYGFPRKENCLLEIEPKEGKIGIQSLKTHYRGEHHYGGICTPEGIVYQPPRDTNHILRIDLNSFETKRIPITEHEKKLRYCASIQHPNGDIYLIPEIGNKVIILHPETEEIEYIGLPLEVMAFGVVVGYDGHIYGFCRDGKGVLKIDTNTQEVTTICTEIGCPGCYGSIVGINGKIIGVPAQGDKIWQFDIETQSAAVIFELEEKGVAKCAGAGITSDGTICFIPAFGDKLYFLSLIKKISIGEHAVASCFFNTNY